MARIKIGNIKGPKGDPGAKGATGATGAIGPRGPLPPLANNFTATEVGVAALDAVAGATLKEEIDQLNGDNAVTDVATSSNPSAVESYAGTCFRAGKVVYLSGIIRSKITGSNLTLLSVGATCAKSMRATIIGDLDTASYVDITQGAGEVKFNIPAANKDYRFFIAFPVV